MGARIRVAPNVCLTPEVSILDGDMEGLGSLGLSVGFGWEF